MAIARLLDMLFEEQLRTRRQLVDPAMVMVVVSCKSRVGFRGKAVVDKGAEDPFIPFRDYPSE